MTIVLGGRSQTRLIGVHPNLVRVVKRAAQIATSAEDFSVLEGVRSDHQCYINFGKGRTSAQCLAGGCPASYAKPHEAKVTWLKKALSSNHRKKVDGYGHAVDLVPYPLDWNDLKKFDRLADLMMRAAVLEGVHIRWGADWDKDGKPRERGETDSPHFELQE